MDLYALELHGYKRFANTWINLDGKTIAVLGPNESGKSSLLEALTLFNNDKAVLEPRRSRGVSLAGDDAIATLRFRLDPEDRRVIPWAASTAEAVYLLVQKTVDGPRRFAFDPPLTRPKSRRVAAREALLALVRGWDDPTEKDDLQTAVETLAARLDSNAETLHVQAVAMLESVGQSLEDAIADNLTWVNARTASATIDKLRRAHEIESEPSPEELAQEAGRNVPRFLPFTEGSRNLLSDYQVADDNSVNDAFRSLLRLGGTSIDDLRAVFASNNDGRIRQLIVDAETRINSALKRDWNQSPVTISFREVGPSLHITLSSHATFFRLDEHSDGMRMFVALRAFVEDAGRDPKPILLIDEAEQHLHYDAQADLIRVLATQTDVKKVIYTTHSIGCLPQDLGRGARLVVPDPEASRSVVKNSWTSHLAGERWDGSAGLSPLMAAMGAKALALTPARTVVVTEGPSDALLLPTLLREATGRASLDYQIIAGLADITEERVEWIEDEAWRVIYLADGDNDGLKKRDLVLKAGVDEFRALVLPNGLTLEDLLAPSLYVEAVNNRLNLKPPHLAGITVADLSERNRSQSVRNWCKAHGIAPPGKIAVGEEIVRLVIDQPRSPYRKWLDKERKTDLAAVHKQIADAIDRLPKRQGAA